MVNFMSFFRKKEKKTAEMQLPPNEKGRNSVLLKFFRSLVMIASGLVLASAFPPLNWSAFAFVSMIGLILFAMSYISKKQLFFLGCIQGYSWAIVSFWWLREIDYGIPFVLALILSLFFGVFALFVRFFYYRLYFSVESRLQPYEERKNYVPKWWRELIFIVVISAVFPCLEYIRIAMFPWNFLGVSQYKNLCLIQIVEYTGIYGVTYLIFLVNSALAVTIKQVKINISNGRKSNLYAALAVLIVLFGVMLFGMCRLMESDEIIGEKKIINFGVVQGDISQRRFANNDMAVEALDIYIDLSNKLLSEHKEVDLVIWPETAVPYPYFASHEVSRLYRYKLGELTEIYKTPFLIGSLDFVLNRQIRDYEMTNAALQFDRNGKCIGKYEKIKRVPFGEFVPLRKIYPDWLLRVVDMGRDLRAGTSYEPLNLPKDVKGGMAICYESIFASLNRRERQLGADMFIAINNDAWYPTSSEPEQHLANAVFRIIENRTPALRVGNNGGTVLLNRKGAVVKSLMESPIDRGRACGVITVELPKKPLPMTFYSRFGDLFLGILFLIGLGGVGFSIHNELKFKKIRSFNN